MPRIPYYPEADLSNEDREYVISQRPPAELSPEYAHLMEGGDIRNYFLLLANRLPILKAFRDLQSSVWNEGGLDPYERELVILSVAKELQAEYEWHQHVKVALGEPESLSEQDIRALAANRYDSFTAAHQSIIEYTIEFVVGRPGVCDSTHDSLADYYDDETILGVAALASTYALVARISVAFDIELESGEEFVGWTLEHI